MRKAQITLWVILGLVFVILAALLVVLFRKPDLKIDHLPSGFQPVQDHMLDCVEQTAVDGLKQLASHGGYMYPSDPDWTGKDLRADILDPTGGDLLLTNDADLNSGVPYYFYIEGPNPCANCVLSTLTPTPEFMNEQLERYILENMPHCVNFGDFQNIVVNPSDIEEVDVTIQFDSVLIEYQRKLTMTRGGQTVTASNFPVLLEVPFGRYYQTARAITQKEIDTAFLENYIMYLISVYSGLDSPLPPLADFEESRTTRFWTFFPVKQELQNILYSTTPMLQVLETQGVRPPNTTITDPYIKGFLEMTYLDLIDYPELHPEDFLINIFYLNDPLYMDIKPRDGQMIKPSSERTPGFFILPSRQQNYYNFFYDVSAPFLFEIRHVNATQNADFSFLFAIEANLRDNKNMVQWLRGQQTIPWRRDLVTYDLEDPAAHHPSNPLANGTIPEKTYLHDSGITSLFCDPTQRMVPVTVQTYDGGFTSSEPLPDVDFTYSCGYYDSCYVGYSDFDDFNVNARFEGELPQCIGGKLKAEKEGYNTKSVRITTRAGQPVAVPSITLDPFVELEVKLVKHVYEETNTFIPNAGWTRTTSYVGEEEVDGNDTVIVMMNLIPQGDEEPVSSQAFFSNLSDSFTKVKLVPGLYEVTVQYLDNDGFVLQGYETPPPNAMCDYYVEDDTEVKPAPIGGLELSDETHYFHVGRSQLYGNTHIVIPFFVFPTPQCVEDLERMSAAVEYTRNHPDQAEITFENNPS